MFRKLFFASALALFAGLAAQAQQHYLFVGSYNRDKEKEGVYLFRFNDATGDLQRVSATSGILNPSFLTISPDGKYIYTCSEAQTPNVGGVSSLAFDSTKETLTLLDRQDSGGDNPAYVGLDPQGKWLICANYSGGSLSVFSLNGDGHIAPASQVIPFKDSSILARQRSSHIHAAVFSPDGKYAFFPDLGADKIRAYQLQPGNAQPLQPANPPFTATVPGSGPRHLTFHATLPVAYCIEEIGGMVSVYKYKAGKLDRIQRIKAHLDAPAADYNGADIHISPDSRFLYASAREDANTIFIYAIDAKKGTLREVGRQSTLGKHPRNFAIAPSGKFLLVANQNSGNIVVFKRNPENGLLTATGIEVKVPNPSSLQIRAYH
ncbi:lactonase family protein [Chitinophaga arvensicola]|uniref:6-phosphogluconolactonase, cycloisomerase 2 family n=1 Tax=Chitinophaga arvensicola TaxID=29529 RepID=A0A1I0S7X4_9BACT|nr:lactonase family protein [Chitinophaga arvensicola]SEW51981.1 6-phosphogluconolactonase, cycloisomerase 2 family [Chitinophaga arvensicola]